MCVCYCGNELVINNRKRAKGRPNLRACHLSSFTRKLNLYTPSGSNKGKIASYSVKMREGVFCQSHLGLEMFGQNGCGLCNSGGEDLGHITP